MVLGISKTDSATRIKVSKKEGRKVLFNPWNLSGPHLFWATMFSKETPFHFEVNCHAAINVLYIFKFHLLLFIMKNEQCFGHFWV